MVMTAGLTVIYGPGLPLIAYRNCANFNACNSPYLSYVCSVGYNSNFSAMK